MKKKILAIILALVMVLSLCACGEGGGNSGEPKQYSNGIQTFSQFGAEYKGTTSSPFLTGGSKYTADKDNLLEFALYLFLTGNLGFDEYSIGEDGTVNIGGTTYGINVVGTSGKQLTMLIKDANTLTSSAQNIEVIIYVGDVRGQFGSITPATGK